MLAPSIDPQAFSPSTPPPWIIPYDIFLIWFIHSLHKTTKKIFTQKPDLLYREEWKRKGGGGLVLKHVCFLLNDTKKWYTCILLDKWIDYRLYATSTTYCTFIKWYKWPLCGSWRGDSWMLHRWDWLRGALRLSSGEWSLVRSSVIVLVQYLLLIMYKH